MNGGEEERVNRKAKRRGGNERKGEDDWEKSKGVERREESMEGEERRMTGTEGVRLEMKRKLNKRS